MAKKSRLKSISVYLRGFFENDELSKVKQTDVLFFCHDFTRNYRYNELYYSSLVDSLNELLRKRGIKPLTLARPYSVLPPSECYGEVFTVNGGFARARLGDLIINKVVGFLPWIDLQKNFFQLSLWKYLIKKVKPKIIIGVEPFKEICTVASESGIPVFDIQHGILASTPTAHFYRLIHRNPKQLGWPDFIIARDYYSHHWLVENRSEFVRSLNIGHPWLSRFAAKNTSNDELVLNALNIIRKEDDKPIILYSLQHLRDANGHPHSYAHLPEILENYIKSEEGGKFTWWLRLHPILLSEPNYSLVIDSLIEKFGSFPNIQWNEPSKAPLASVLRLTDLHLTRDSSLTTEAAFFGIKTGFLDKSDNWGLIKEAYKHELSSGQAMILDSANSKELISFIESSISTDRLQQNSLILTEQNEKFENFIEQVANYVTGISDLTQFKTNLTNTFS